MNVEELRQCFPLWAHLTDDQIRLTWALYSAVRKKFHLDEVDRQIAQGGIYEG